MLGRLAAFARNDVSRVDSQSPSGRFAALRLLRMVPVRYLRLLSQEEKQLQLLMPAPSPHLRSCATLPADPDGEGFGHKMESRVTLNAGGG